MVTAYLRYSTQHQNDVQQRFAIEEYAADKGLVIDQYVSDEGISGGVSYKDRNLNGLIKMLKDRARQMKNKQIPAEQDALVVSELSRLGRSMSDISALLNELKAIGVRLVIIKSGIDYDCANLKAQDEFLFAAMSFAAQVEKELIQSRTQSAIDARKELIKKDGGFVSKTGNFCDHLGRKKGDKNPNAVDAMSKKRMESALDWKRRSPLYMMAANMALKGEPRAKILQMAEELYEQDPVAYGTRKGRKLSKGLLSQWVSEITIRN